MIKISNLEKSFGKYNLFNGLDISFPYNGLYLIKGPNGCGKTSLLYIIGLIDLDYCGTYELENYDIKIFRKKDLMKIKNDYFSFVLSKGNLIPFLNVEENINFNVKDKSKIVNFIPELDGKQNVLTLSGGEELLVSLSHEVSLDKKIYLLDEVTSNLDDENVDRVMKTLIELSKHKLVIMTAHDDRLTKYVNNIIHL